MNLLLMVLLAFPAPPQTTQPTTQETYPAMVRRMHELTVQVQQLSARVRELEKENFALRTQLVAAATQPADEIADAIKHHHLAVGMTLDEANSAMLVKARFAGQDGDKKLYRWVFTSTTEGFMNGAPPGVRSSYHFTSRSVTEATFVNDKLTAFEEIPQDRH